jgi:hypothetical protein
MTPEDYAVSFPDRMLGDTLPGPRRDDILAIRPELLSGVSCSELKKKDASFDYPISTGEREFLEEVGWPVPPDPGREAGGKWNLGAAFQFRVKIAF